MFWHMMQSDPKHLWPGGEATHLSCSSRRYRCTVPWPDAAHSSAGRTEAGLKASEYIAAGRVPRLNEYVCRPRSLKPLSNCRLRA